MFEAVLAPIAFVVIVVVIMTWALVSRARRRASRVVQGKAPAGSKRRESG